MKTGKGQWYDLFYKLNTRHQRNRFSGTESLMLSLSSALRYYASTVHEQSRMEEDDQSNINFVVLKHIVVNYLGQEQEFITSELSIIILIKSTSSQNTHAHYYKIKS